MSGHSQSFRSAIGPYCEACRRQPCTCGLQAEAERIAACFHETYERLAPEFGYKTRDASAVPWEDVPEQNRKLMCAVAAGLVHSGAIKL